MRRLLPVIAVVAIIAGLLWFRRSDDESSSGAASGTSAEPTQAATQPEGGSADVDPFRGRLGAPRRVATTTSTEPMRVTGSVTSAIDGSGVEAEVIFRSRAGDQSAFSDASGKYSIEVTPGTYTVLAIADKHVGGGSRVSVADRALTHDIVVAKLATVEGRVTDGDGQAIEGANIEAWVSRDGRLDSVRPFWDVLPSLPSRVTDANGHFEIPVPPEEIVVRASANSTTADTRVEASLDEVASVHIVIDSCASASGVVTDRRGSPVANAPVQVNVKGEVRQWWDRHQTVTDDRGRFSVDNLRPGQIYAEARPREGEFFAPPVIRAIAPCEAVVLNIREAPRGRLEGRVLDAKGNPIPGASLRVKPPGSPIPQEIEGESGQDGAFAITVAVGARYRVRAHHPNFGSAEVYETPDAGRLTLKLN